MCDMQNTISPSVPLGNDAATPLFCYDALKSCRIKIEKHVQKEDSVG
jgi:hypothetical protein